MAAFTITQTAPPAPPAPASNSREAQPRDEPDDSELTYCMALYYVCCPILFRRRQRPNRSHVLSSANQATSSDHDMVSIHPVGSHEIHELEPRGSPLRTSDAGSRKAQGWTTRMMNHAGAHAVVIHLARASQVRLTNTVVARGKPPPPMTGAGLVGAAAAGLAVARVLDPAANSGNHFQSWKVAWAPRLLPDSMRRRRRGRKGPVPGSDTDAEDDEGQGPGIVSVRFLPRCETEYMGFG